MLWCVQGLSPGIDNIHSFIKGARTEPKNRQALAGMVLILVGARAGSACGLGGGEPWC